jgi:hypothetical protein
VPGRRSVSAPRIAAIFPAHKRSADADGPEERVLERRRADDIAFIEWLRSAPEIELRARISRDMPMWRRAAVARKLAGIENAGKR